ncbi:MAG: aldehyde ferredoxin oxidoreductase N-terminal domain-containing protein [Patescibacteria group bacterium]
MANTAPTFLHLDLSSGTSAVISYEELIPAVGGLGFGLALFEKFYDSEKEAPIVLAIGLLSAILPGAAKTVAVFRSPQTGGLATSMAGGGLAKFIRFAGFSGIVLTGTSPQPVLASIREAVVEFKPANSLLDLEVPKVFERIYAAEGISSRRSVLVTGPAADRGISFTSAYVDEFFSFARSGLGAAMAKKNFKGLAIAGGKGEKIKNQRRYEEVFNRLIKRLKGYGDLSQQGTLKNLKAEGELQAVPTNNLSSLGRAPSRLLAEEFGAALGARRVSCAGCPVGCIHVLRLGKDFVPYDYEGVTALGPLLGLDNPVEIGSLLKTAWDSGLDPTSLGLVLGYLTEKEKLKFGDFESYKTLIQAILAGKEKWAQELWKGLPEGEEALVLGGLEALPYFNGYASLASQAFRLGATTEENRGFVVDLEFLGKEPAPKELVGALVKAEKRKILSQLLVGCGYLSEVFEDPATAFSGLDAVSAGFSHEDLKKASSEIFQHFLKLQKLLGFDPLLVKIPKKFLAVSTPQGKLEEEKIEDLKKFYAENVFAPTS